MNEIKISQYLSNLLRHNPQEIGLTVDRHGYADLDELITLTHQQKKLPFNKEDFTLENILTVVRNSDKQRFSVVGDRIRANQGHTIKVELNLPNRTPPATLFHGTVAKFLPSIKRQGLITKDRHAVHLSKDIETATKVGQRRGSPVILTIDSVGMAKAGILFQVSDNGVWLTDHVPAKYIQFP